MMFVQTRVWSLALLVFLLLVGCVRGPSGSSQNSDGGEGDMSGVISDMTIADMGPVREDQSPEADLSPEMDQSLPEDQNAPVDMRLDLGDMHDSGFDMSDASVDMPWDMTADMLDMSPPDLGDMPCDMAAEIAAVCGDGRTGDPCNIESAVICGQMIENPCQNAEGVCLGGQDYVCNNDTNECCNKASEIDVACRTHRQLGGCGLSPEVEICGEFIRPDCGTTCASGKCCLNTNACVSNHCSANNDCSFWGLGDRCNTDTCQCN